MANKKYQGIQTFLGISGVTLLLVAIIYSSLTTYKGQLTAHDSTFAQSAGCDTSAISQVTFISSRTNYPSQIKCATADTPLYLADTFYTIFKTPSSLAGKSLSYISTDNVALKSDSALSWTANFTKPGDLYVFYRKIPGQTAPTWLSSYTRVTGDSFSDINQFFLRKNQDGLIGVYDVYRKTLPSAQTVSFGPAVSSTGTAFSMYIVAYSPAGTQTTPAPTATSGVTPAPTPINQIPSPVTGEFKIVEADPAVTTSNTVNSFIKNIVKSGTRKVAASGAWWGPTTQFFKNQEWVVVKNIDVGKVYPAGSNITVNFTCIHPGDGTPNNGLTLPTLRFQLGHNDAAYTRGNPLGNFVNSTLKAPSSGSDELRTVCLTKEGKANLFGDGTPKVGEELHTNLDQSVWFGSKGTPGTGTGNHLNLPAKYDLLDSHSWYTGIEYAYGALDGAHDDGKGDMSTNDLVGATVKGNLTVYGFAFKRTNESTVPVHHVELRIEQNDEDYTVTGQLSPPTGGAIPAQKKRFEYTFDTTKVSDGWHIMSWHMHVINEGFASQAKGHQLAGEIKIPICVNNKGAGSCP